MLYISTRFLSPQCLSWWLSSKPRFWMDFTNTAVNNFIISYALYYPNVNIPRNSEANILFFDIDRAVEDGDNVEGTGSNIPILYKNRVQAEALKYAGRSVYPKVKEMLKYGELIDEDSILGPMADTFLSSCYQKQNTYVPKEVNPNWRDQS